MTSAETLYAHAQRYFPGGVTATARANAAIGRPFYVARGDLLAAVSAGDPLARTPAAQFSVIDCGLGRVALQSAGRFVSVVAPGGSGQVGLITGTPTAAEMFQWTETPYGDLILLSLATHRHLRIDPRTGAVSADQPGPLPDRSDGSCLSWNTVNL